MSRVTNIFADVPVAKVTNREAYPAFDQPIREQYLQTLLTNTMGNTFYATATDLIKGADALHREVATKYPDFASKAIVYARNSGYMRTQPIYGLAVLASVNGKFFEKIFDKVIRTPNDLVDFTSILKNLRGNHGGRKIKRLAGTWLIDHLDEYRVIKYGSDGKSGYSLKDLFRIYHPNLHGVSSPLINYVLGKEVSLEDLPKVRAFEKLKRASSTAEIISAIKEGGLPHEVASTFAKDSKVWESIVPNLPTFALLRNLATIERHGVLGTALPYIKDTFTSADIIERSMILPFRFLEAINHVSDPRVKDYLRMALELSFKNIPDIAGITSIGLDISGSMNGDFLQKGSVFAIALAKKSNLSGKFYLFDNRLEAFKVSMVDSILTQANTIHARGGTDTSLPFRGLLTEKFFTDNIILITDEQQNTGTSMYKAYLEYKNTVNKNVKLFIIDVAPYVGSQSTFSGDKSVYYIYGWSDRVLEFISATTKGYGSLVKYIESM